MTRKLITPTAIAEQTGLSYFTVIAHLRKGNIPGARLYGRSWLIPQAAVDAWRAKPRNLGGRPRVRFPKVAV